MRIFIGLTEIAGYCHSLRDGFLKLGHDCVFVSRQKHVYSYETQQNNLIIEALHYCSAKTGSIIWRIFARIFCLILLLWAIFKFDVFIFMSNSTFLPWQMDLPILKVMRKKLIFIYSGSDARPPYINGAVMAEKYERSMDYCVNLADQIKQTILRVEKFADEIVSYPQNGFFHERKFVSGFILGFPKSIKNKYAYKVSSNSERGASVRILHSPSDPEAKGTPYIRQAIKALQEKGHCIEYTEIIGRPNEEVLQCLAECDFVVDQVFSDTPLAGFATEAAFFGKPAVVGGYYADYLRIDVPEYCIPPSEYVHPQKLEQAIERLIVEKNYRLKLGKKAMEFADSYLCPEKVAHRYERLIRGDFPKEWYFDPKNIRYLHGACLPEERAKRLIQGVIRERGINALQLSDKPEMEQRFLAFAGLDAASSMVSSTADAPKRARVNGEN